MFRNNVCRKYGGTVFAVKDFQSTAELFGPQLPHYNQRVIFDNNVAAVGNGVATQTTTLRSASNDTTIRVTDYNSFLRPSLVFRLVDDYNNVNTTDFATTVSIFSYYRTLLYPTLFFSNQSLLSNIVITIGHCDRSKLPLWDWFQSCRISQWGNDGGSKSGCGNI